LDEEVLSSFVKVGTAVGDPGIFALGIAIGDDDGIEVGVVFPALLAPGVDGVALTKESLLVLNSLY
jgi:hypothetical protein